MEMEPLITAGAAVALSVAGFFMSNQRSRPKANLRATRSESDLRKMRGPSTGSLASLSGWSQAGTVAAAALDSPKDSSPADPTSCPGSFRRGLKFLSTDEAHSNVLQRISLTPPSLPTLLEEPEEHEGEKQQINQKSKPNLETETEKNSDLEKEKEIEGPHMLAHKLLKGGGEAISNKPNSLFPRKTGHHKTETETIVEKQKSERIETMSNKLHSLFPTKDRQPKKEPETKLEQEKINVIEKNLAIKYHDMLVRDLLEIEEEFEKEEELEMEEEIKYLHILPQTLLETKEEIKSICPPNAEQPKNNTTPEIEQEKKDDLEKEKEIERLRALADTLLERERNLEIQMLEYYGLKEQEEAMKEMEHRLKSNSTEAKCLSLKVESLEEENQRLKNQILELEKATSKLDKNKEKIKMLKQRLSSEDDNAKEKIAFLRDRIETLADKKEKSAADYEEMENKLERVKVLEEEVNELKKLNARLEEENSGLTHRLENVQFVTSSTMRGPEEKVLEEATRLREMNEKLEQEIGQLRTDHNSSVEEVVYLRWLNECLRYELKNHSPSTDKGVATDVNRSPSYHSREKFQQLLQDYYTLGIDINETNLADVDFDYSFSSQTPSRPTSPTSRQPGKHSKIKTPKFFGKIKKIVTGKTSSNPDKDKDKDRMSLLASDHASVSCSEESSPSSSTLTIDRLPRSDHHLRSSLNFPRSKNLELESARSNSDLRNFPRGEPKRYHALHLDHPLLDTHDDRESNDIKKLAHGVNSSKPSSRH